MGADSPMDAGRDSVQVRISGSVDCTVDHKDKLSVAAVSSGFRHGAIGGYANGNST
jgi:hypothetical protein